MSWRQASALLLAMAASAPGVAASAPSAGDSPPANLLSGTPAHGAAIDPVFSQLQLRRLRCGFREDKRIALLARPLTSTGTIYFDRDRGIVRTTRTPRAEKAVLTRTALRIQRGDHTEEIPLDKSKDLQTFALVFPTLLRGERAAIERSFDIALYGRADAWWALVFTPRSPSLRGLVRRVVVFGRAGELLALQIAEASGDTTDTRLSDVTKNGDVPDTEIAAAFGAP